MRYRDTGPHERREYWAGHMRNQWSNGPRPPKFKQQGDPTALNGTHENLRIQHVSRRKPNNKRVTRPLSRDAAKRLFIRIRNNQDKLTKDAPWAIHLAGALGDWLTSTNALETHTTITILTNGQWRALSRIR